MTWWGILPPIAVEAAIIFVPGWLLLRAAGVRGLLAVSGGPAVSAAYLGLAGIVLDRLGVTWGLAPLAGGLVPLVLLAAACGAWVRRSARARGVEAGGLWSARLALGRAEGAALATASRLARVPRTVWVATAVVLGGLTIAVPIMRGSTGPDGIVQQWDAVFHASGVQLVRDTGNASLLGAMQGQFGAAGAGIYYPSVWHGVVSLAPGSVALVANASVFVIGGLVWLLGLAGLGRVLGDKAWSLAVWTVLLGAAFGTFPSRILVELAQWPFGMAIALIPGAVALAVAAGRTEPGQVGLASLARGTVSVLVAGTAVLGVALTHGSAFFSLLMVLVPLAAVRVDQGLRVWWAAGRRRRVLVLSVALGAVAVLGIAAVLTSRTIRSMAAYEYDSNAFFLTTVYRTLFDLPTAPGVGLWPLAVLAVLGAVAVRRDAVHRRAGWLAWALVVVLATTCLSAGPDNPFRVLAGFWYSQTARVVAVYPVVAAPLAAFGLLALARWVRGRWAPEHRVRVPATPVVAAAIVAVLFLATAGWNEPRKESRTSSYFVPGKIRWGTMLSSEEIALIKRLPSTTSPDAVILGDPANGAAFAFSVAHRHVVFPQLDPNAMSQDQRTLRFHFDQLMTEPTVCDAVRRLKVTHFYQDTATVADGAKVSKDSPGLTTPVTPELAKGLAVVDTAGTATLYRITACSP